MERWHLIQHLKDVTYRPGIVSCVWLGMQMVAAYPQRITCARCDRTEDLKLIGDALLCWRHR